MTLSTRSPFLKLLETALQNASFLLSCARSGKALSQDEDRSASHTLQAASAALQRFSRIDTVAKYGRIDLKQHRGMDELRKTECLCLSCIRLQPNSLHNCAMAQAVYNICRMSGCAMSMTRCPDFIASETSLDS